MVIFFSNWLATQAQAEGRGEISVRHFMFCFFCVERPRLSQVLSVHLNQHCSQRYFQNLFLQSVN